MAHFRSNWSERHAAFVAGLGTFSLNRSLITRSGAAGRIGSVVTDAPFPATRRPYAGPTVDRHACGACIQRCPCGAIDASGKDNVACKAFLDSTLGQVPAPLRLWQMPDRGALRAGGAGAGRKVLLKFSSLFRPVPPSAMDNL